ncbi:molybdopterin-dependent oxidoreductase [Haladaptatus sp. NG-SE-30]
MFDTRHETTTDGVRIAGEVGTPVTLDRTALEEFPQFSYHGSFLCASGTRWDGYWRGVSLGDLLDFADVHGETTHVQVVARDDFTSCVPVIEATEGVLALHQSKTSEDELQPCRPRFVAGGIQAPRSVKDVVQIRALRLANGEHPEEYEQRVDVLEGE